MNLDNIKVDNFEKISAFIEIPYRSNIKYELNKESGTIEVDRVLFSSIYYPANYGFIPSTLSNDGDPIDILVINENAFQAGSIIQCRLVGVLITEDESGMDEKLLAVPISKIDSTYDDIKDINDLPKSILNKIKNFFETYKLLEPNKWVKVKNYLGKKEAIDILEKSIKLFKKKKIN